MLQHSCTVFICMCAIIATPFSAYADDAVQNKQTITEGDLAQWIDPPLKQIVPDGSANRSTEQLMTLETRLKLLEDRMTLLSKNLKAERLRRHDLEVQVKAALQEADDITTQARADNIIGSTLVARSEALKKQFEATAQNREQPRGSRDAKVDATLVSPPVSSDNQSLGKRKDQSVVEPTKRTVRKTDQAFLRSRSSYRNRRISVSYRADIGRRFVLPDVLRPIRF